MFDAEKSIAEGTEEFKRVVDYVRNAGQSHDAHTVERSVLGSLLALGRHLLTAYFEEKEGGNVGPAIETESGQRLPRERVKSRRYLSVFGELELARYYYHKDGAPRVFPLDEATNLPDAYYSYFVQERARASARAHDL